MTVSGVTVLELNEAGSLSSILRTMPRYTFGAYPEVDMRALPYPDSSFDLVVHSDTLEHVPDPVSALRECHRVLKMNGALCFTIPIIVGRMSRSREGLPKSFHGNEAQFSDDFVVQTEFGADAWTYVSQAGFNQVEIHTVEFPSASALLARKGNEA
jgi:ubiquinone/menaquinone biosynthesis C-methylase UbiE